MVIAICWLTIKVGCKYCRQRIAIMLWHSLYSGLKILTCWEVYVAALGYLVFITFPIVTSCVVMRNRRGAGTCIRCLNMLLPIIHVIAITVSVIVISPIILGVSEHASWSLPVKIAGLAPEHSIGLIAVLVALAITSSLIPVIRKLHSLQTLIIGCISLMSAQIFMSLLVTSMDFEFEYLIPDFWFAIWIVAVFAVVSTAGHYIARVFLSVLKNKFNIEKGFAELMIFPMKSILGFVPVIIYGTWIA